MPKVKTTYAYKIQSIVKEFPDQFMESINNQLYCNLCNCAVSCNKRAFLLILIEIHRNIKKRLEADLKILSLRLRKRFLGVVTPILLKRKSKHFCLPIFLCTSLTIRILKTSFVTLVTKCHLKQFVDEQHCN